MDKEGNLKQNFDAVQFGSDQLAYLESLFPPTVYGPATTEAQLRHYHGAQAVVEAVRNKTRGQSIRVITTRGDIPAPR